MISFGGQVCVVTGGSGQLGQSIIALLLARTSMIVVVIDVSPPQFRDESVQSALARGRLIFKCCDISSRGDVRSLMVELEKELGSVSYLINNAGVSVFEPFLSRPEESIDWVMNVNLKGVVNCTSEYALSVERVRKRDPMQPRRIVNVASVYGVLSPDPRIYSDCDRRNSEIYGATKAGVIQLTKYYAVHLAEQDITVNCVAPGGIFNPDDPQGKDFQKNYSQRCPLGRMATVDEITWPIIFLLSDQASYVNGQNFVVDGGMSVW